MKNILKSISIILFLLLVNRVNAQQCQVPELYGGWFYQNETSIDGAGETITRQISFSPSGCIPNIEFNGTPDWITITRPNAYSIKIVVAENTTMSSRLGPLIGCVDADTGFYLGVIRIDQKVGCYVNWYPDSDGDGIGDLHAEPIARCDNDPPFIGAVTNNDDACPEASYNTSNGCEPGYVHEDRNWTYGEVYSLNGILKKNSKSYFDNLGKGEQNQVLDVKTNKTWATHSMYDAQGRPALQTLSAPINSTGTFLYKSNFIENSAGNTYTEADFEPNPEEPSSVANTPNTLGHYYSQNNTNINFEGNSYQDVTNYPFSRTIYSKLNPGAILKTIGSNKVDTNDDGTPDSWLQSYAFTMRASNEMSQVDAFNNVNYNTVKTLKTVSRDLHGVETVVFTDTNGKTLGVARSGGNISRDMSIEINDQGFVDIHIPVGVIGFNISSQPGIITKVYDLITEELITVATNSLTNGFYRVAITNLDDYDQYGNPVSVSYKENYYDYSLSEYDKAERLIAMYQPLHKLKKEFKYNSIGQSLFSKSPDAGEAWFKYRKDGQIRFSQNSKQVAKNEFSYTNYDNFGRPVESGVFSENSTYVFDPINNNSLDAIINNTYTFEQYENDEDDLPNGNCKEQQLTLYDEKDIPGLSDALESLIMGGGPQQRFVAGNVSRTSNENTTTWYSYDIYGRVEWMVQNITGLGVKTIDYSYDPITGNILEVDYQKYVNSEHFVHKYTYNSVDELELVETSTNGTNFIEQAHYYYYETGALRRVELADNLQGIDYVYNLAGLLKAINDPNGNDPGDDGNSIGDHSNFEADVFSMSLDYYKGDYTRTSTPKAISSVANGTNQFNGNIKAMTWKNMHPNGNTDAQTYYYGYNKNNWLESAGLGAPIEGNGTAQDSITNNSVITIDTDLVARQSITLLPDFHVQAGTVFTAKIDPNAEGADGGAYNVSNITYDANGNIRTLNRNKQSENGGSTVMDQLSYEYYDDDPSDPNTFKPNQLKRVNDAAGDVTGADDIGDQNGNNYKYNSIGQLIENVNEDIKYFYNTSGLVREIQHDNQAIVKFYYNDKNQRVRKENFTNGILNNTDYYIRDARGNTLAIYKNNTLEELPIYGAGRIGVHYRIGNGIDRYQLTDHLGNVRAVVERADPTPKSTTDYYPFGMVMPGKQTMDGLQYRYAFQGQEKDSETGKEAFQLRLWDSRIGRWLTTDPAKQYSSPYLGMGNDPINGIDPDGAFKRKWWAKRINFLIGGDGVGFDKSINEYFVKKSSTTYDTGIESYGGVDYEITYEGIFLQRVYDNPEFFIKHSLSGSIGLQFAGDVKLGGAKIGAEVYHKRRLLFEIKGDYANSKTGYSRPRFTDFYDLDKNKSGFSLGLLLVGGGAEFSPKDENRGARLLAPLKFDSEEISFPVYGNTKIEYDKSGVRNANTVTTRSWNIGVSLAVVFGIHGNANFGFKY